MNKEIKISDNPSKTQKKREAAEIQSLGVELTEMHPNELDRLGLDPKLRQTIDDYQKLPNARGARKRQIQFIGKIMRSFDVDVIKKRLTALRAANNKPQEERSLTEELVEKITTGGDAIINELIASYRNLERLKLRKFQREISKLHPQNQNDMKTKLRLYLETNIKPD